MFGHIDYALRDILNSDANEACTHLHQFILAFNRYSITAFGSLEDRELRTEFISQALQQALFTTEKDNQVTLGEIGKDIITQAGLPTSPLALFSNAVTELASQGNTSDIKILLGELPTQIILITYEWVLSSRPQKIVYEKQTQQILYHAVRLLLEEKDNDYLPTPLCTMCGVEQPMNPGPLPKPANALHKLLIKIREEIYKDKFFTENIQTLITHAASNKGMSRCSLENKIYQFITGLDPIIVTVPLSLFKQPENQDNPTLQPLKKTIATIESYEVIS